ncbi:MAG: hypothetical protein N3A63_07305 [Bacteroidetes bacterium]|nr:hypothetical protein [Bacteroidota bacterium]
MNCQRSRVLITVLIIVLPNIFLRAQTAETRAFIAKAVKSIGDTLFYGVTDFDFMPDGSLIVCDRLDYKVKLVSRSGKLVREVGQRGTALGEFRTGPLFLAVGKSQIAVAEYSSPRVQLFTHALQPIREFRVKGFVMGLKYDNGGCLWIGTHGGLREYTKMIAFDENGNTKQEISLKSSSNNIFENLYYFTIYKDTVYVAYAYQNIIERYYGTDYTAYRLSFFPAKPKYTIVEKENNTAFPEEELIYSLAIDQRGLLYILGGDCAFNPFQDVFIVMSNGKIAALLTLPEKSKKIALDKEGYLWSLERNRTVLTRYSVSAPKK